jgi:lipid-binding SYLF domain-containing protein
MPKSQFSLKPMHTEDPVDGTSLFARKEYHLEDDSPLPTSALPYIYTHEGSPTRSQISTSIFPPMKSEPGQKPDGTAPAKTMRRKEHSLPSASDTIRQATTNNNNNNNKKKKNNTSNKNMCSGDDGASLSNDAKSKWQRYNAANAKRVEERERNPIPSSGFSARITASQSRTDASGKPFTSYIMCVETNEGRYNVEHRYSDFSKLYRELKLNEVELESKFPMRSWAGRIGDWTPSLKYAPEANKEMVRKREKMLDVWMMELCQEFQQSKDIHGELRQNVERFFQNSSTAVNPCDRSNDICWDGLLDNEDGNVEIEGQMRREGGVQKYVGNPISFTLSSSIRQAAYTVMHMCGTTKVVNDTDKSIPLDLLQNARGLVFLTVAKAGLGVTVRGGSGLMIAKREDGGWTPPVALGIVGAGWGAVIGGDITNYMIVLNTERAVKIFAQSRSVNLGSELSVAIGPIGRSATANVNATARIAPAPAYAYAHSKGLFLGITIEGSIGKCAFVKEKYACSNCFVRYTSQKIF